MLFMNSQHAFSTSIRSLSWIFIIIIFCFVCLCLLSICTDTHTHTSAHTHTHNLFWRVWIWGAKKKEEISQLVFQLDAQYEWPLERYAHWIQGTLYFYSNDPTRPGSDSIRPDKVENKEHTLLAHPLNINIFFWSCHFDASIFVFFIFFYTCVSERMNSVNLILQISFKWNSISNYLKSNIQIQVQELNNVCLVSFSIS